MSTELRQIKTRVTPEFHARWKARLAELRLTDSEAMRLAMSSFMGEHASSARPRFAAIPESRDRTRRRQQVRLTCSEIEALDKLAQSFGTSRPKYIVNLIRAHLLREPQLNKADLDAVRESNDQLTRTGTNLNQIARKQNAGNSVDSRLIVETVNEAYSLIKEHRPCIYRVMRSNLDRWVIVEASHDQD